MHTECLDKNRFSVDPFSPYTFIFPASPLVHTFLSVLPSWSTKLFCWYSEEQLGPSKGHRQVKICFDDSKWRDYPNERQLSKLHPSPLPFNISMCPLFFSLSELMLYKLKLFIIFTIQFHLYSLSSPISVHLMFFCLHHLDFLFPLP